MQGAQGTFGVMELLHLDVFPPVGITSLCKLVRIDNTTYKRDEFYYKRITAQ